MGFGFYRVRGIIHPDPSSYAIPHVFCSPPAPANYELNFERYDGGPLLSYLQLVKKWLDANPNEGQSRKGDPGLTFVSAFYSYDQPG